jgi:hypothetical protein
MQRMPSGNTIATLQTGFSGQTGKVCREVLGLRDVPLRTFLPRVGSTTCERAVSELGSYEEVTRPEVQLHFLPSLSPRLSLEPLVCVNCLV